MGWVLNALLPRTTPGRVSICCSCKCPSAVAGLYQYHQDRHLLFIIPSSELHHPETLLVFLYSKSVGRHKVTLKLFQMSSEAASQVSVGALRSVSWNSLCIISLISLKRYLRWYKASNAWAYCSMCPDKAIAISTEPPGTLPSGIQWHFKLCADDACDP